MFWVATFITVFVALQVTALVTIPQRHFADWGAASKRWDYYLAAFLYYGVMIAGIVEATLFPSSIPATWRFYGLILFVGGMVLGIWARRVNPYFLPNIQSPPRVIRTGPYQFFNHPGYVGFALGSIGTVLLLASKWAMAPMVLYLVLLYWRARAENKLLYRR